MADELRLTPIDRNYLHMEAPSRPIHWAFVVGLQPDDGPLSVEQLRERVRERSALYPVFSLGVEHGHWRRPKERVLTGWDAGSHISAVELVDEADERSQLVALAERPVRGPHPLWDVTLLTRRDTGVQSVVLRVHHCLSDGIAGAAFAALFVDGDESELSDFDRFAISSRYELEPAAPEVIRESRRAMVDQWRVGQRKPRWPRLTRSGLREVELHTESTREVRRVALGYQASVQEYLMAVVGSAISLAPPVDGTAPPRLRVAMPVTMDTEMRHSGNAVGVGLVNLLGDEPDLGKQLDNIRAELQVVESRRPELALAHLTGTGQSLPWAFQRLTAKAVMTALHSDINVGVTPGYSRLRSICGKRITGLVPLSPLAGYSLSVTILVLGDQTTFGIVTDAKALPGYAATFTKNLRRVLETQAMQAQP